jgi:hypothetical protein
VYCQGGPKRVLIVKKPVPAAAAQLEEMANWLQQQGLQVRTAGGLLTPAVSTSQRSFGSV